MPQFQQLKKGYARVRILPEDATRAYLMLMKHQGAKLQGVAGDVFVVEEQTLELLQANQIRFEVIEKKD